MEARWQAHAASLAQVELVALDVDGVLTDGRVVYLGDQEVQAFDVQDGAGIVWLQGEGVRVAWISGRGSQATWKRARELGVDEVHVKVKDKRQALEAVLARLRMPREAALAMGDDLPDLALARAAGFFVAPANARAEVRARADVVTAASGGRGAVRELAEALLRARGAWDAVLRRHGAEPADA